MWEAVADTLHHVCSLQTGQEVTNFVSRVDFLSSLELGSSTRQRSPLHKDKDAIVAGAPGLQLERTDSGISACSHLSLGKVRAKPHTSLQSCSPDEVKSCSPDIKNLKTSTSSNHVKTGTSPVPTQPLKPLKWIKIDANSVRCKLFKSETQATGVFVDNGID